MNRAILFVAIFLLIFAVVLGAVWFISGRPQSNGSESEVPSQELTKSSGNTDSGNVSVDVTLVTEDNASELNAGNFDLKKQTVFYVEMNTHSIDISAFKMEDISFLTADGKKSKALKWESTMEGGGHHRDGFLVFEKSAEAKKLKLIIKGIPNIAEREFSWNL